MSEEEFTGDLLANAHIDGTRVVVADGQIAGVLHAHPQSADRDPAGCRDDAVIAGAEACAVRSRDVHARVTPPEELRDHAADRPREAAISRLLSDLRCRGEHIAGGSVGLEQRRELGAAHEDLLAGRAALGLEVAAVEREDDRRVHFEIAGDRIDGVPVLHGVERAFGGWDHKLLTHPQCARIAQTVRICDRFDRNVVVVRHGRERVAVVDRDLLRRARAFGGHGHWIAAARDRPAACDRLGARRITRGRIRRRNGRSKRVRARRRRCRERKRQDEHRHGGVEREPKAADADHAREIAAAFLERDE